MRDSQNNTGKKGDFDTVTAGQRSEVSGLDSTGPRQKKFRWHQITFSVIQ